MPAPHEATPHSFNLLEIDTPQPPSGHSQPPPRNSRGSLRQLQSQSQSLTPAIGHKWLISVGTELPPASPLVERGTTTGRRPRQLKRIPTHASCALTPLRNYSRSKSSSCSVGPDAGCIGTRTSATRSTVDRAGIAETSRSEVITSVTQMKE